MPDFYHSGETENLLYKFVEVYATMFDIAEEDLLSIMKMHWVKTADNALPQSTDIGVKGDLDKIFTLYLESLGATALLKQGNRRTDTEGGKADDALYRQRILSVINVLKNGAATKSGIIDIIAANLGIAEDLPFAKEAKETIEIVEYLPEVTESVAPFGAKLFIPFTAKNESLVPSIAEFRLKLFTETEVAQDASKVALPPLLNARIVNLTTGESVQLVNGVEIKPGDEIIFLPNGTGLLRGQTVDIVGKKKMTLPHGDSVLRFEAEVGYPTGAFDRNKYFDFAQFDKPLERQIGLFDKARFDGIKTDGTRFDGAVFNYEKSFAILSMTYLRLFPGSFTAVVPWDIAGFSTVIKITERTLRRLPLFGVEAAVLDKVKGLLNKEFDSFDAFSKALTKLKEDKTEDKALKDLIARECDLTDKYQRFDISPRAQLSAIINRVKAAGVFATIAFEKRFWENQGLEEAFGMVWQRTPEDQGMVEANFTIESRQINEVVHEIQETFAVTGVFDYTNFDSLNGFA